MMKHYDAIIIGTGQSGPSLAVKLADSGQKVAIVERKRFGGSCVNYGCIPTKTMVASARAAYMVRRAAEFGVDIKGSVHVNMKRVKARKDLIVKQATEGIEKWLKNAPNCDVYEGGACFEGPKTVRVGDTSLTADKVFINVGTRPFVPPIDGIEMVNYLTNKTIMDLDTLAKHLVIIGGGYIALEFAQMYRRFGSAVTVIERGPMIMAREDDDICEAVRSILEKDGVNFYLNSNVVNVAKHTDGVQLELQTQNGIEKVRGSHLLVAVGRLPNTNDLGLEKAGIATNQSGFIEVDDQLKTNVDNIWAIGDCNGKGAFTHTSYNDYEIVAENLLQNGNRRISDRFEAYALYVDPPLAHVGLRGKDVRAKGIDALIAHMPMTRVGRAKERSETAGFMKILVDKNSKQILGATFLGINADEVIHVIINMMYAKAPYTVMLQAMDIHPTVSELLPTLLLGLKPLE